MIQLPYTGERAVPWRPEVGIEVMTQHVARYAWAFRECWGRRVIDLGCGAGYGSYLLSWGAAQVIGLDVRWEAVAWARKRFRAHNLSYDLADVENDELPAADVYVAFEVLEHLQDPGALLDRLAGTVIWSLPVDDGSRFHTRAYSVSEIME